MTPLFVVTAGLALAVLAGLGLAFRHLQRRVAAETLDRAVFDDFDAALQRTTNVRAGTTASRSPPS